MPNPLGQQYVGRYTQMLQNMPNANNGTAMGALSNAVQQGLQAYSMGKDDKAEKAAYAAISGAENQQGAIEALKGLQGNPVAGRLATQLQMGNMENQQYNQRFDAQQAAQDQRYDRRAQQQDARSNQQLDRQLQMQQNQFAQQNAMFDRKAAADAPIPGQVAPVYSGQSVEAQALNGLVASGVLTREQAMTIGAGKTITGSKGETIFMTPQGIVAKMPGQAPQPVTPPLGQGAPAPTQPGLPPQGQPTPQQQGQAPQANVPGIALTDPKTSGLNTQQAQAAGFADRMSRSIEQILSNQDAGTDYTQNALGKVPLVGNSMVSDEYQVFDQARRDFINAQLRRESGAAIAPSEIENATAQYMPRPGDGPDVLAQKEKGLMLALSAMVREAGPAYTAPEPQQEQAAPNYDGWSVEEIN